MAIKKNANVSVPKKKVAHLPVRCNMNPVTASSFLKVVIIHQVQMALHL